MCECKGEFTRSEKKYCDNFYNKSIWWLSFLHTQRTILPRTSYRSKGPNRIYHSPSGPLANGFTFFKTLTDTFYILGSISEIWTEFQIPSLYWDISDLRRQIRGKSFAISTPEIGCSGFTTRRRHMSAKCQKKNMTKKIRKPQPAKINFSVMYGGKL